MTVQQTTTSVQRLRRNRRTTTSKQAKHPTDFSLFLTIDNVLVTLVIDLLRRHELGLYLCGGL